MVREQRMRFWVETAAAVLAGLLALVTLVWREWVEAIFGVSPDRHNGSLEWVIVATLMTLAVTLGFLARAEARRPATIT